MKAIILIGIVIILLFSIVFSQEPQEKKETLYDKLLSKDKATRIEAYNALLAEIDKTREYLLKIATEAKEVRPEACTEREHYLEVYNDTKSLSILLLAKYPSKSVVDFLLDSINCGRAEEAINAESPFFGNEPTPAVLSLIEIGMLSIKAILERIGQEKLANAHHYGYVIEKVLGKELGAECLILEYRKAQEAGKKHKMNNIEKILREWFYFAIHSQKAEAFLKELDNQREQEKQKQ